MSEYEALVRTAMAIRSMADAMLAQLGAVIVPAGHEAQCDHPAGKRVPRNAFGQRGEHWTCGVCGYEHDDEEPATTPVDGR